MGYVRIRAWAQQDEKVIEMDKSDGSKIGLQNNYAVYICYNVNCKRKAIRN